MGRSYIGYDSLARDVHAQLLWEQEQSEVKDALTVAAEGTAVAWTDKHEKRIARLLSEATRCNNYGGEFDVYYVWYQPDATSVVLTTVEGEAEKVIAKAEKTGSCTFTAIGQYGEFGQSERVAAMFKRVCKHLACIVNEDCDTGNQWQIRANFIKGTATLSKVVPVVKELAKAA